MMCVGLENISKVCLMVSGWPFESRWFSKRLFKQYVPLAFIDQVMKIGKDHRVSGCSGNSSPSAFCVFVVLCYRTRCVTVCTSHLQIVQTINRSLEIFHVNVTWSVLWFNRISGVFCHPFIKEWWCMSHALKSKTIMYIYKTQISNCWFLGRNTLAIENIYCVLLAQGLFLAAKSTCRVLDF